MNICCVVRPMVCASVHSIQWACQSDVFYAILKEKIYINRNKQTNK